MERTISLLLFCVTASLYTGLAGLVIGLLARSLRIALGCGSTLAVIGGGIAAGLWAFGVIY